MIEQQRRTITNNRDAQTLISLMIRDQSISVDPCSECELASEGGCTRELKDLTGETESIGPIYDPSENAVVCPIQKGVIFINGNLERKAQSKTSGKLSKAIRNLSDEERRIRRDNASERTLGIPVIKI